MQRPARVRVHNLRLLVAAMLDVGHSHPSGLLLQSLYQYSSDSVPGRPMYLRSRFKARLGKHSGARSAECARRVD